VGGSLNDAANGAVSWELARRVASRIAERQPLVAPGRVAVLEEDFAELTAEAEALVEAETGLRSLAGPARARVMDRPGWANANVASFQRLLRPLTAKLEAVLAKPPPMLGPVPMRVPAQLSRNVAGAQLGLLLGWMSTRVLGQYDQLLIEEEGADEQDIVYYIGPNIVELEDRYGFQPRQFRLWIALHELTHRAQFTGVPWLRPHFLSLVGALVGGVDPDPRHLLEALRRAVVQAREGRNPLDDGGLLALLATPEQRQALDALGGLMSLLEGHGDIVMNRVGAKKIPQAQRFANVLRERRQSRGAARVVSSLVGVEAKLRQYEQGERFVHYVEEVGGRPLFERVWQGPEWLPSLLEVREPRRWVERTSGLGKTA
jgi:coenzyme F420 biosynthesis associated uncharacterized protein